MVGLLLSTGQAIALSMDDVMLLNRVGLGTDRIVEATLDAARRSGQLRGKTVVVTAGPTREPLDPVRYLSNRSSGKMGYALAAAVRRRGARVHG